MAKLKGINFSLREQKQGGLVNNYFQTSHNETFNKLGNPNSIRSVIPQEQRDDARKQHYYLGFDKSSTFKGASSTNNTYDFKRNSGTVTPYNRGAKTQVNSTISSGSSTIVGFNPAGGSQTTSSLVQANAIASKQKVCNVQIGGASSNARSLQGDRNKTSNQSFFRWIQPKVQ